MNSLVTLLTLEKFYPEEKTPFSLNITFKKDLSRNEVIDLIGALKSPQVILWYIGDYGLREQGVNYYKKDLRKLLKLNNQPNCFLYDLTAWAAFRDSEKDLDSFNQNADAINEFGIPRLKCIKSKDFFRWLKTESNPRAVSYVKETILKRKFIFQASADFPETHIKVRDIFRESCPILEGEYERDTGKIYSAIQYIEGCYLIDRMLEDGINENTKEINLVFMLANDESKYYEDSENCLAQDVAELVQEKYGELLRGKQLNVMFYTFKFGLQLRNRPYNAGPKNIENIAKSQLV